jgi:hypothetical protein
MKLLENTMKLEDKADIALLTDLVMSDEIWEEEGTFIKDNKKYYLQTYYIEHNDEEISIEVFVNWEDDSETCEIDFYVGQEFLIR